MECPYCKAQNRDGVRYCGSCGKQIGSVPASLPLATPGNSGSISRSLLPDSRLQGGRYLVKQVLGEGGMGTASLAQDMRLDGKLVVIKELLSEQTDASENIDIMGYLAQQTSPIVHHDIKPANIIIGAKDKRAHLVDCGIARADETNVVATMLSDATLRGIDCDDLQGAYVAQKEYNNNGLLHAGVKVLLLIANLGSQTQYADQVAGQIVQLAKSDPTFIGVMGWPYSSRSLEVVKTLTQAGIPIVAQTSSSDDLINISPYFFRVAPANKIQGIVGAHYAEHALHAMSVALFVDPTDSYSQSLAQDFSQQFQADGNQIVATEDYTKNNVTSISSRIADALGHHPDIMYFSGYATVVDTLISNPLSGTIPVMGGDALYELSGYPHSGVT